VAVDDDRYHTAVQLVGGSAIYRIHGHFNVESEFLSLFVHGYKKAESRDSLVVANQALKQQPWVAIFYKASPNPLDKMATREHEDEMIRVKECLKSQHSFEFREECQWALKPPANVEGFVSGKI